MRFKKLAIILILLIAITGGAMMFSLYEKRTASPQPLIPLSSLPEAQPFSPSPNPLPTESPKELPEKFLLQVPFTPQAPTGNWDEMHGEACEETSALMAAAYFAGDTRAVLPAAEVEKQLADLTAWQEKRFGYSLDSTAEETAEMIRSVYHLKTELVADFTEQDIKKALAAGHVIIVPLSGRELGNPYFRQPGPIYHMIVIRGYTEAELITNDPGTKRGENYPYSFATIKNAGADWNHTTGTIDDGKSIMIVVSK